MHSGALKSYTLRMMHAFGTQQFIGARAGRPRVRAQLDPAAAVDLKLFRARAAAAVSMLAPLQPTSVSTKAGCSPSATLAHGQRWRRRRRLAATAKSAAPRACAHTARASGSQTDSIFLSQASYCLNSTVGLRH